MLILLCCGNRKIRSYTSSCLTQKGSHDIIIIIVAYCPSASGSTFAAGATSDSDSELRRKDDKARKILSLDRLRARPFKPWTHFGFNADLHM